MRINVRFLSSLALVLGVAGVFSAACVSNSDNHGTNANVDGGGLDVSNPPDTDATPGGDGGADADATPPPPAAGGTGAFGIITVDGKQKLYLPLTTPNANNNAVVAVVDVGLAGNGTAGAKALIKEIELGDFDWATASGGDSNIVIAVSIANRKIRFIDPKTDTLVKTIELPGDYGTSGFSGGGGYVTGVAVDSTNHRAILSVYDGFQLVDLTTMTLGAHIKAAPVENFGFDSVRNRIVAPFYECNAAQGDDGGLLDFCNSYKNGDDAGTVITDGLNVIDLADNSVYTYVNPSATDPSMPLGSELDSAAVDPSTGVAVVPSEGGGHQNIVDLAKASFDKGTKTFTAPVQQIDSLDYTGVSVEPVSHYAFWEQEGSSDIAVANLGSIGKVVRAQMPMLPASQFWSNMGDPHGVAVAASILDGKPYGFLVSSDRKWVARVDLKGLVDSIQAPEGGTPDGGTANGFVTYLDTTP